MTDHLFRLTGDQIRQLLAAEERGTYPDCFACGHPVTTLRATLHYGMEEERRVVTMFPCEHRMSYNMRVAEQMQATMQAEVSNPAATEATELDKSRRYLRPVRATIISDDPDGVHLAVYEWLPAPIEEWVTGPGICGESMMQGPLPDGSKVTCASCLAYQPQYERMLAPGYNPADDDPEALRRQVAAARKFAAEMRDFCSPHGVAADYADRLIEAMDRAKESRG